MAETKINNNQLLTPGGTGSTADSFEILATDPVAPADGDVWYNSTDDKFRFYQNGAVVELGSGGTGTATDFQILAADPVAPADGDVWYNSTDNKFRFYENGAVSELSSSTTIQEDVTPFAGTSIVLATTVTGSVYLFKNGVLQTVAGSDYSIAGQTITLSTASIITDRFTALIGSIPSGTVTPGSSNTYTGTNTFNGAVVNNSTVTNSAASDTTYADESTISNQADETFGAGYEGVYQSGSSTVHESGSITDFEAGSSVDFTGATVTGLSTGSGLSTLTLVGNASNLTTGYTTGANKWGVSSVGTQTLYLYNSSNGGYWTAQTTTGGSGNFMRCASNGSNLIYVRNNSGVLATELFKVDSTTFACTQVAITAQGGGTEKTYFLTDRNVYTFETATGIIRVYALSGATATFTMSLGTFGTSCDEGQFRVKTDTLEKLYFVDSASNTVFKTILEDGTGLTTTSLPTTTFGGSSTYYFYDGVENKFYSNVGMSYLYAAINEL